MSVYKRGGMYWYEFVFNGARIRESAKTTSKTIANEAERARRRELERAVNGISKRERPPLFPIAARDWLKSKTALSPLGLRYYTQYVRKLSRHFTNRLLTDIAAEDVAELQRKRQAQGRSGRQINAEVGTLRTILRYYGRWAQISARIRMLPQRSFVGKALSQQEEERLLNTITQSRSPSLYPFFVLSLDAGLRPSETRALRRSNLRLVWRGGAIAEGEVVVGRSKTEAGAGRAVPLTRRACGALTLWLSRFADSGPDAYLFPFHRVAIAGDRREPWLYDIDLNRPMSPSSYATGFRNAPTRRGYSSGSMMRATLSSRGLPRIRPSARRPSASLPATSTKRCSRAMRTFGLRRGAMPSPRSNVRPAEKEPILRETPHKIPHSRWIGRSRF
jgi:integrase